MVTTVGRPLEFDPNAALEAAMHQFWSKGYEHTSLQDLVTAMNLSKSSLYQAFGSKQQLLQDFLHSVLKDVGGAPRGCLVMNTASELGQSEPEIARDVAQSIGRFRALLQAAVERAQREGAIAPDRDPRTLASYLVSSMSGLKTQAKAGADAETLKGIITVILSALSA